MNRRDFVKFGSILGATGVFADTFDTGNFTQLGDVGQAIITPHTEPISSQTQQQEIVTISQDNLQSSEKPSQKAPIKSKRVASKRVIYLTIDDGWYYKNEILNMANHYNVPLNMFIIGEIIAANPSIWTRAIEDGHMLGSHTYRHPKMSSINYETAKKDFKTYSEVMLNKIGKYNYHNIDYFRYPYGDTGKGGVRKDVASMIADNGWRVSWWDTDLSFASYKYGVKAFASPYDQLESFRKNIAKNREVMLFHFKAPDHLGLELIIKEGLEKGYTFARLDNKA